MTFKGRISILPSSSTRQGEGGLRTKGVFKSSGGPFPLVTVVTVVFNGEEFLEETIQRIVNQTYKNLEFIVIDGGSSDRSVEIIRKYDGQIDYWVSEKDFGIGDAFNKGVQLANGDYINFQGDGDGFVRAQSLEDLMVGVNPETDMLVSGQIQRTSIEGKLLYTSKFSTFRKSSLLFRMSLPHQGLLTHIKLFQEYGLFDVQNKFCMDYEFLLRAYHHFPKVFASSKVLAIWRADGLGNGRTLQILKEYDSIKRKNLVAPGAALWLINYWSIFKFRLKQILGRA